MESITFNDPVSGKTFSSDTYEVRKNGSNTIARTKAPSGAMAVRVRADLSQERADDISPQKEQFASDITQKELNNMIEDYQDNNGIATNPGAISRGIGRATQGIGGFGAGS